MSYDHERVAAFYDEYGEREWTRFEDGRTSPTSLAVHVHYLHRFVRAGDRVLDVGAGPGRFTIELARLGAEVVVADISPVQLELNRQKLATAGLDASVSDRIVADVTDLAPFEGESFDAAVCYGGPISYSHDRTEQAVAELVRVTRPGGHVLLSVMSLAGTIARYVDIVVNLARRDGTEILYTVLESGFLPEKPDYGHLDMRLFRWRELRELLAVHGEVVAASAAGLLKHPQPEEPEVRALLTRLELELAAEPGAIDGGEHILAVVRKP